MATLDCAIIGGGPAGCSAASWSAQLGHSVALIERASAPCPTLIALDFAQEWVLGQPHTSLATLGRALGAHARQVSNVQWHLERAAVGFERLDGRWRVALADGAAIDATALVLATGLRARWPAAYPPPDAGARVMDAITLAARRATLPLGRTLLLGGGDNALENADYLGARGHEVTVWTRGDWRGRPALLAALQRHGTVVQRHHAALPDVLRTTDNGVEAESTTFGRERFDRVAVLFGFEPEPTPWHWLRDALRARGLSDPATPGRPIEALGVFVAGDASVRWHPCVQTALADGVQAAQQVDAYLRRASDGAPRGSVPDTLSGQVLQLSGLRFGANVGVLPQERGAPQPIQVDAELNLGCQSALARDAGIHHVLDYRRVRQIVIDECTAEHTDLLESLLAKLCARLMRLPGVLGVRIRVAKLAIFDDCEVAIRCEAGLW
jgi:dihydroneopterin aldolase